MRTYFPITLVGAEASLRSDGMIIFPAAGVFAGLGGTGVSMFFVSCVPACSLSRACIAGVLTVILRAIISQLIYSAGGSGFAGANGSMMIEVVVSLLRLARVLRTRVL